jgi:hypothetical protein
MSMEERARLAAIAISESHAAINAASRNGHKPASARVLPVGTTMADIEKSFATCTAALQVLRDLSKGRKEKCLDNEKAALEIVLKYIAFDMVCPCGVFQMIVSGTS